MQKNCGTCVGGPHGKRGCLLRGINGLTDRCVIWEQDTQIKHAKIVGTQESAQYKPIKMDALTSDSGSHNSRGKKMYKSRYFSPEETGCRCGKCDMTQGMKDHFLIKLDRLRQICGFPIVMSSGYRCPEHEVNPDGPHGDGLAADLKVEGKQAYIVQQNANILKFRGIGIKQKGEGRFIHVDDAQASLERPRPAIWSY